MDIGLLDVALLVGLTARLTRLAVVDDIADPARVAAVRVAGRAGPRPADWIVALLGCPFCIGFWISGAVVASWLMWGSTVVWQAAAGIFTLSYVTGHLVARADVNDEEQHDG